MASGPSVSAWKFWVRFLESDEFERIELLKLLIEKAMESCIKVYNKDRSVGLHCLATLLNGYFSDFEEVLKKYDIGQPRPQSTSNH